jgi:hypothetical protein
MPSSGCQASTRTVLPACNLSTPRFERLSKNAPGIYPYGGLGKITRYESRERSRVSRIGVEIASILIIAFILFNSKFSYPKNATSHSIKSRRNHHEYCYV